VEFAVIHETQDPEAWQQTLSADEKVACEDDAGHGFPLVLGTSSTWTRLTGPAGSASGVRPV